MNNSNTSFFTFLLIFIGVVVLLVWLYKKFKTPNIGSLCLVNGAVKSGKTTFALSLARSNYRRSVIKWYIKCFIIRFVLFRPKSKCPERPLFYTNAPVRFPYVEIDENLITRKVRPRYGSTFFIQEASLLADNSTFKDKDITERVMLFNKLFGHETCGGLLVYDTQSIGDMPAVTRRCLGQTMYVHHLIKWIPFVIVAFVKEQRYSEDGTIVQVDTKDVDNDGYRPVIILKSVWKKFDCYCYSALTDDLPVSDTVVKLKKTDSLKCKKIISFRRWKL